MRAPANPGAVVGAVLIAGWLAVALAAPILAPFDPLRSLTPLAPPGAPAPGGGIFLLGSDLLGRDILSRLIWGARNTVTLAAAATGVAYAVGVIAGLAAGYFGGWTDGLLVFASNVILSFPVLILFIVLILALGASSANIVLAVAFAIAPAVFRIVRTLAAAARRQDYVSAAILQGESALRIMLVDILPNCAEPLAVDFCLRLGYTTITIGALGFLGLGLPPPAPDWGGMVNDGRALAFVFPHLVIFPCIAIASFVLGLSLLADGLKATSARRSGRRP